MRETHDDPGDWLDAFCARQTERCDQRWSLVALAVERERRERLVEALQAMDEGPLIARHAGAHMGGRRKWDMDHTIR